MYKFIEIITFFLPTYGYLKSNRFMGKKGTELFNLVANLPADQSINQEARQPDSGHKSGHQCQAASGNIGCECDQNGKDFDQSKTNAEATERGFADELLNLLERRGVSPEHMTIDDLRAIALDYLMEVASLDVAEEPQNRH